MSGRGPRQPLGPGRAGPGWRPALQRAWPQATEATNAMRWLALGLLLSALMLASCGGKGTPRTDEWTPRERSLLQRLELMHMMYVNPPRTNLDFGMPVSETERVVRPGPVHTRGSNAWELANVMGDMEPGQHRIVYLAAYGSEVHLRIRRFAYPGGEAVLWHGRGDLRGTSCVPSPDFSHIAMLLRGTPPLGPEELLVIPLDGGEARRVAPAEPSRKWRLPRVVFWRDGNTLEILVSSDRLDLTRWVYTVGTRELEFVADLADDWAETKSLVEECFGEQMRALERAERDPRIGPQIAGDLGTADRSFDILRGAGIVTWTGRSGLNAWVAVSADGEYVAIKDRRKPMVVIGIGEGNMGARHPVPRTDFLSSESVSERDLRWSPDSKYLTFTEAHHHPARFHAPDMGGDVSKPWDTTYLVRLYSVETNEVKTIAVGRNGFLLPDVLPPPT